MAYQTREQQFFKKNLSVIEKMGGWVRVCFFKGKLLTFIEKTWVHGRPGKDSRHPETIPKMEQKTNEKAVILSPKPGNSNFLKKSFQ